MPTDTGTIIMTMPTNEWGVRSGELGVEDKMQNDSRLAAMQSGALDGVIRFSLRHRPLIVLASLAVLVYGGIAAVNLPIDIFPDLDRPRVVVMTEVPGLAAEEVESQVTFPLESALLGATGVQTVRSQSGPGLSVVYVEFDWSANIHIARQTVQERLTSTVESLPPGVKPQMSPISSILGQIMHVGVVQTKGNIDETSQRELRTLADWTIRPRLLKIPGVAQVVVMGGGRKQYQVLADPNKLLEREVTLADVEEAVRRNNLNASGGFANIEEGERAVRVLGRIGPSPPQVIDETSNLPVKLLGDKDAESNRRTTASTKHAADLSPVVRVQNIGRVAEGNQPKRGDASVDGRPAVVLTITKQPHIDTRLLTEQIRSALDGLAPALPKNVELRTDLFQLKRFIDKGVYNVGEALVIGAVLVLIVLFVFLLNFRTTFISLTAIPLSLAVTTIAFRLIGWLTGTQFSINVMTLGGIAVAMGELVDDAIVDVENVFRRLKENRQIENPKSPLTVIYEASVEIRSAIVFGTAMVIMVFVPLFALSGIEGRLFAPLGVAYIVSILASLLVSLTVTPVLAYYLLPNARAVHVERDSPLLRLMKWLAGFVIRFSMRFAGTLLAATWILVAVSFWVLSQLGSDFLPAFDEGTVQVTMSLPPGSSLDASNRMCLLADKVFRKLQKSPDNPEGYIVAFARRTGRAELDEHAEPPSNSEYLLDIDAEAKASRSTIIAEVLERLRDEVPGVDFEVEQPLAHLISHMLSGVTAQVAIKIFGDDLEKLRRAAESIKGAIATIPGVSSLAVESQRQVDEIHIRLRPEQLSYFGIDRQTVGSFLQSALRGETVGQIFEGQKRFDIVVKLDEPYRSDFASLSRLRVELPGGRGQVSLGELAMIDDGLGPNVINRDDAKRRIAVRCNALGRDLGSVVGDIRSRLDTLQRSSEWPKGYYIELGGQFESQRRATMMIGVLAAVAFVGMFVVLYTLYPSARVVCQILNALPAAFIGGVIALALSGQTLTVASLVGFISLAGIAARNGILLVSHYFHLMRHEGEAFSKEMVLRGSLERLAPVLMTALTAGIGLVPLVLEGQKPGREILYPVATVILGGLVTSTLCEYLLHPGLFWKFSGKDALMIAKEKETG